MPPHELTTGSIGLTAFALAILSVCAYWFSSTTVWNMLHTTRGLREKFIYAAKAVTIIALTFVVGGGIINAMSFSVTHFYSGQTSGVTAVWAAQEVGLKSGRPYPLVLGGRTVGTTDMTDMTTGGSFRAYANPIVTSAVTVEFKWQGDYYFPSVPLSKIRFHESTTEMPRITFLLNPVVGQNRYGSTVVDASRPCTPLIKTGLLTCHRVITSTPRVDGYISQHGPVVLIDDPAALDTVEIVGTPAIHDQIAGTSG